MEKKRKLQNVLTVPENHSLNLKKITKIHITSLPESYKKKKTLNNIGGGCTSRYMSTRNTPEEPNKKSRRKKKNQNF